MTAPGTTATTAGATVTTVGFDLDMTLVDSAAGIAETLTAALAEQGVAVAPDQVFAYNGVPLEDTVLALAPAADLPVAVARYRELYPELGVPATRLLPGAIEAVAAVHRLGARVAVVSTKVDRAVRLVLRQVGLTVDEISGGLFAQAKGVRLRELGATVYVGDHPGDVRAAATAGARSVAVATGPHTVAQLTTAGADVVLRDLRSFPVWLDSFAAAGSAGVPGTGIG